MRKGNGKNVGSKKRKFVKRSLESRVLSEKRKTQHPKKGASSFAGPDRTPPSPIFLTQYELVDDDERVDGYQRYYNQKLSVSFLPLTPSKRDMALCGGFLKRTPRDGAHAPDQIDHFGFYAASVLDAAEAWFGEGSEAD